MTNISAKFYISVYFKENETISMQTVSDESWKLCEKYMPQPFGAPSHLNVTAASFDVTGLLIDM